MSKRPFRRCISCSSKSSFACEPFACREGEGWGGDSGPPVKSPPPPFFSNRPTQEVRFPSNLFVAARVAVSGGRVELNGDRKRFRCTRGKLGSGGDGSDTRLVIRWFGVPRWGPPPSPLPPPPPPPPCPRGYRLGDKVAGRKQRSWQWLFRSPCRTGNPRPSVRASGGSGGNPRWLRDAEASFLCGVRRGVVGPVLLPDAKSAQRFPHDGGGLSSCIRSHERKFGASRNTCDRFGSVATSEQRESLRFMRQWVRGCGRAAPTTMCSISRLRSLARSS